MQQVLRKTTAKQENILSKAMLPVLFYLRAKNDVNIDVCVFLRRQWNINSQKGEGN